ncbi:YbaB/EbfC family nucleoid-associated protein [Actinacidiphila glaucinigra]|uniref:YbaB/EbfC family nucleoid-associated protein n=1 Tax=Actinacidiphila glaucinigra TaxID=235986 RepID=UPI0035D54B07
MTSSYDQQIDDLLVLYRRQREEAVETRRRINEVTGTATASRQAVKATVSAQGEVVSIEFPTGAYRRMSPKELSEALVSTLRQARGNALEAVGDITSAGLPAGVRIADLLEGRVDASAMLEQEPGMPDLVREYLAEGHPEARDGGAG